MSSDFPKKARLRTRREYQHLSRHSSRMPGRCVILEYRPNGTNLTRAGITVSKQYGSAVQRNRFKRIVREAFRLSRKELPQGYDINIKPRNGAYKAKPADIISDLSNLRHLI